MRHLPISLYPTAAQAGLSDGLVADMFGIDIREVRAQNAFTRDLLASRAIEMHYIDRDWDPHIYRYDEWLCALSHAILGHWSTLLTASERYERRHVLFVLRIQMRKFNCLQPRNHHVYSHHRA